MGKTVSTRQTSGGDMLEVGAWFGRSAVVIGEARAGDEDFTVIDLFGDSAPSEQNTEENVDSHPDTRSLLKPQGIVVADDWRTIHAPGVGAAIWNLVEKEGFAPICVSAMKFYGTWGDPDPYLAAVDDWLATRRPNDFTVRRDVVHGRSLIMLTDGPRTQWRNHRATARDAVRVVRQRVTGSSDIDWSGGR